MAMPSNPKPLLAPPNRLPLVLLLLSVTMLFLFACSRESPEFSTATSQAATATQRAPADPVSIPATGPNQAATEAVYLPLTANEDSPTITPLPTKIPVTAPAAVTQVATDTPSYPIYDGTPIRRDRLGVQIHLHREDIELIVQQLKTLGVGWVKVQVSWKIYEPQPGEVDEYRLAELDRLVDQARANSILVMLGVSKAPEWSRSMAELDGPPIDFQTFGAFMSFLASRYHGRVAAYELWNEPNLMREWNGALLDASETVRLIRVGAAAVRQADPSAITISAAPATTGINDGVTAIDDRQFLRQMLAAGLANLVDAIGVHPYGWANPPDSRAAAPDPSVPSHNNHPSFFFLDTLDDYHELLESEGWSNKPLWVTEFGWGSYDGLDHAVPPEVAYMAHVSEEQQARYTLRAIELTSQLEWVGPVILWNLNFGSTFGPDYVESAYSLLRYDGSPRPIFQALSAIPKLDQ